MSQQNKEQQQEESLSIISSNNSNDFIIIGQSAYEQGEEDVNEGHINPQPNLPFPATGTTEISYLKLKNKTLKAENKMLKEKMKNMELEQKNTRLQETIRKWQRSQHRVEVDELSELKAIQQEEHQTQMQELKGKMVEYSKEFGEKLEIQEKQHKREIGNMKDFINTHVRGRQQQQQKPQAKCSNPPPKSSAIDNNEDKEEMVHLTEKEMQKIKHQGNFGPNKPPYSNISLIAMAIKQSSSKMCTVIEIFGFITTYFDYYKNHSQGILMHNSVRHSLEFNDCFVKVPQMFEHLYGCKWKLHEHCGDLFENQESASNF